MDNERIEIEKMINEINKQHGVPTDPTQTANQPVQQNQPDPNQPALTIQEAMAQLAGGSKTTHPPVRSIPRNHSSHTGPRLGQTMQIPTDKAEREKLLQQFSTGGDSHMSSLDYLEELGLSADDLQTQNTTPTPAAPTPLSPSSAPRPTGYVQPEERTQTPTPTGLPMSNAPGNGAPLSPSSAPRPTGYVQPEERTQTPTPTGLPMSNAPGNGAPLSPSSAPRPTGYVQPEERTQTPTPTGLPMSNAPGNGAPLSPSSAPRPTGYVQPEERTQTPTPTGLPMSNAPGNGAPLSPSSAPRPTGYVQPEERTQTPTPTGLPMSNAPGNGAPLSPSSAPRPQQDIPVHDTTNSKKPLSPIERFGNQPTQQQFSGDSQHLDTISHEDLLTGTNNMQAQPHVQPKPQGNVFGDDLFGNIPIDQSLSISIENDPATKKEENTSLLSQLMGSSLSSSTNDAFGKDLLGDTLLATNTPAPPPPPTPQRTPQSGAFGESPFGGLEVDPSLSISFGDKEPEKKEEDTSLLSQLMGSSNSKNGTFGKDLLSESLMGNSMAAETPPAPQHSAFDNIPTATANPATPTAPVTPSAPAPQPSAFDNIPNSTQAPKSGSFLTDEMLAPTTQQPKSQNQFGDLADLLHGNAPVQKTEPVPQPQQQSQNQFGDLSNLLQGGQPVQQTPPMGNPADLLQGNMPTAPAPTQLGSNMGFTGNSNTPQQPASNPIPDTFSFNSDSVIEQLQEEISSQPVQPMQPPLQAPNIPEPMADLDFSELQKQQPSPANMGQPNMGQPNMGQPNMGQPNMGQPNMGQPNMGQPNMGQPNMGQPNMGQPNMGQPNMGQPNMGQPNMGQPNMGQPNMGQPNMGQPDMGQPNMGQPNMGQPDMGQPNTEQPNPTNMYMSDNQPFTGAEDDIDYITGQLIKMRSSLLIRFSLNFLLALLVIYLILAPQFAFPLPAALTGEANISAYLWTMVAAVVVSTLCSGNTIGKGILSLLKLRPSNDTYTALAVFSCLIQGAYLAMTPTLAASTANIYLPIAVILLLFNTFGKIVMLSRINTSYRFIHKDEPKHVVNIVDNQNYSRLLFEEILHGNPTTATFHKTKQVTNFLDQAFSESKTEDISKVITPMTAVAAFIMSQISYLFHEDVFLAATVFTGTLCITAPLAGVIVSHLPLSLTNSRLSSKWNTTICGYDAVAQLSEINSLVIPCTQVFPVGSLSIQDVKILDRRPIDEILLDASSILNTVNCDLSTVFISMIGNPRSLAPVDGLEYTDNKGIAGWVKDRRLNLGNREYMESLGIALPPTSFEDSYISGFNQILYLASAGQVSSMFIITYRADKSMQRVMDLLYSQDIAVAVNTFDPNITPKLIADIYDFPVDLVTVVPSVLHKASEEYMETSKIAPATLIHDGTPNSYVRAIIASKSCKRCTALETALILFSVVIGFAIVTVFAFTNQMSSITWITIALYQFLWLIIQLAIPLLRRT